LLSARNKRLGDYVAGTVVVHERPLAEHAETSLSREPEKPPATPPLPAHVPGSVLNLGTALLPKLQPRAEPLTKLPSGCDVSRLSGQEFELIEAFLLRRRQLAPDVRMQMARKITDRVATKLEVSEEDQRVPERLLELVAAEYRNRARFR
jgi:hypothetical protein